MADGYVDVDRAGGRFGLTGLAAAVLMVVFGLLILLVPRLAEVLIGIYLVVVGLMYLVGHFEGMRYRGAATAPPPPPPPPPGAPPPSYRGPPMP